jgi:hypothetical protein
MQPQIVYIAWLAVLTLGLIYSIFRRSADEERIAKLEQQVKALQSGSAPPRA